MVSGVRRVGAGVSGVSSGQLFGALAASAVVLALLMRHAGLVIDPWAASTLPYYLAASLAVLVRLWAARSGLAITRWLGDGAEYYALFTAIALVGAVASYPLAAMTHGYADAALHRIDTGVGVDWLAWYRLVASSRGLQLVGTAAYESIFLTPAILLGCYAVSGRRDEAHRFLASFWLAAVITLALFTLMPAVGPLSYLWHGRVPYMPVSELWQPDLIPALRAHSVHVVDLGRLRGIVSAPSFHTVAATLYIAFAWRLPRLRWPLLVVNSAMLLATPVEGTHYFADMLIGSAVGLVAMAAVSAFANRRPRLPGQGEPLNVAWS